MFVCRVSTRRKRPPARLDADSQPAGRRQRVGQPPVDSLPGPLCNVDDLVDKVANAVLMHRRIHDMLTLTYRALNGNTPVYIKNLLNVKDITYNLRGQHLLNVPRVNTTTYGLHSFRYFASKLWNSLPNSLRTAPTTNAFKLAVNQIKFDRDCCPFCNLA